LRFEGEWLTSYVTHPGLVMTDMAGAINVVESVSEMLGTLDKAGSEISGTFHSCDGTVLPW